MYIIRLIVTLLVLQLLISGCVAVQPFPIAARSLDTITLAVGSADGISKENTTVEFFADPVGSPFTSVTIPVREVIKLYPDKTSKAWLVDAPQIPRRSSHGAWLTVVVVDLPMLPEGADGVIRVSTNGEVLYPRFAATPNDSDFPITILPGTGVPNSFDYKTAEGTGPQPGDLASLSELYQVIIKPEVPAEGEAQSVVFGAIEMDITIPMAELSGGLVLDEGIAVILDDQPQNTFNQTQLIWRRTGDDFKIMLVSPKGMYGHEARVSIVPRWPAYLYGVTGTPVLNSITYYDLDGGISTGPYPTMPMVTAIVNPLF